jgi:hypothetical protein
LEALLEPNRKPCFPKVFVTYGSKQGAVEHKQTDDLLGQGLQLPVKEGLKTH